MKNFSKRLTDLRQSKGLTQNELAELVNVSRSALSLYELGKREPDYETLVRLADFFDVSVDYLLGKTDIRKPFSTDDVDLEEMLRHSNVQFDGAPLTEEEKESVLGFIRLAIDTIRKKRR